MVYTKIQDINRQFMQASLSYFELSQKAEIVAESDLLNLLTSAVTCAILAAAGPQRSRMLANLYKDIRTKQLQHFDILEKMYLDRFLKMSEVKKFEEGLLPHQKSIVSDNYTVLQYAVLQHNIVAISKIYNNISFGELANLLEIPAKDSESMVATMVAENRIQATLDQLNKIVSFESGNYIYIYIYIYRQGQY